MNRDDLKNYHIILSDDCFVLYQEIAEAYSNSSVTVGLLNGNPCVLVDKLVTADSLSETLTYVTLKHSVNFNLVDKY